MILFLRAVIAVSLFGFGFVASVQANDDDDLLAAGAWESDGYIYEIEPGRALFVGQYSGFMFIGDGTGALDAAELVCPGTMEADLEAGTRTGEGRCILTGPKGNRVYAKWMCSGDLLTCRGTFTFINGTGPFKGITGTNEFIAKTAFAKLTEFEDDESIQINTGGLAFWPELKFELPSGGQ